VSIGDIGRDYDRDAAIELKVRSCIERRTTTVLAVLVRIGAASQETREK
jgi:hypothetical protein